MGYLDNNINQILLQYQELQPIQKQLKIKGIKQMLNVIKKCYKCNFQQQNCTLYWGQEVQTHCIKNDPLYLIDLNLYDLINNQCNILPQYGRWMIETIPKIPYNSISNTDLVIQSMKKRYSFFKSLKNIKILSLSCIPFLGTPSTKFQKSQKTITNSLFIDDKLISNHPRFRSLTKNIRLRRKQNVCIKAPLFIDEKTSLQVTEDEPYPGYIYMDAMAFGMGLCCLQTTYSTKNICHARILYDQLHVLSPFFLALTASTPIHKGKLCDWDVRWNIIRDSVDCRTDEERNPLSKNYIPKSRYSSISYFISDRQQNMDIYNDINFPINKEIIKFAKQYAKKIDLKLDQKLLNHIGFLFLRDFIILYKKMVESSDEDDNVVFQHIQSTNWNSVRFKPPPINQKDIGWRVQFRTCQMQLTDDQNSAIIIYLNVLINMFYYKWNDFNIYIPISKCQQNFERAHKKNALVEQKFFFRINIQDMGEPLIKQLTLYQIFYGCQKYNYKGLFNHAKKFAQESHCMQSHQNNKQILQKTDNFIKKKLLGVNPSLAQWIRKFVTNHKNYKQDSIISQVIMKDLINTLCEITSRQKYEKGFQQIYQD